jgi:hypothetical protein
MFHYLHSFNFYVIVRLHVSSLTIVSQLTVTKAQWLHPQIKFPISLFAPSTSVQPPSSAISLYTTTPTTTTPTTTTKMSQHDQETSLIDYEDFLDQHDQDTRLIDSEDVMEVGLQDFVRKLNLQPTNATITPDKLKHGHHLIEALESGLDDSFEPLDRLRKLRLSGEARHLLDMDLTKDHDVIPDWLMFPQADKEQYDGIPDWANGTEVNPMPTTLRQVHLHHELLKYLRCGKPTLAVIMRIVATTSISARS